MRVAIEKEFLGNEDLVIGTPEYNKQRYPGSTSEGCSPVWLTKLKHQKADKERNIGKSSYFRDRDGIPWSRRYQTLNDDIFECIAKSLHLKTKSFEYIPKTGVAKLYGREAMRVNKSNGILSFTLKNIDNEKSRFRLRKLGINLTSSNGKTYWKVVFGKNWLVRMLKTYGGLEGLRYHWRNVFPYVEMLAHPADDGMSLLKLELRKDIYYQCLNDWERAGWSFASTVSDSYFTTDIFGVPEQSLADPRQLVLELEEPEVKSGLFVKPGISIRPFVNLNLGPV